MKHRKAARVLSVTLLVIAGLFVAGGVFTAIMTRVIDARYPPGGRFVPVHGGHIHLVEEGPADPAATVVLVHGASANLADMMATVGRTLTGRYRVIAVDRPGHGWSDRPDGRADAAPARQAALIHQALREIGVRRAIIVGHSLAGAVVTRFALDYPAMTEGLVLLAPATHPWPGGVTWYYTPATMPLVGWLFNHTLAMPAGFAMLDSAVTSVFAPQSPPGGYESEAATELVLRPSEFRANAEDVKDLLGYVKQQYTRYSEIKAPTVIITGDDDTVVSPQIHSQALHRQIEGSKLIVLKGVGHVPQAADPGLVRREIDAMVAHEDKPAQASAAASATASARAQ